MQLISFNHFESFHAVSRVCVYVQKIKHILAFLCFFSLMYICESRTQCVIFPYKQRLMGKGTLSSCLMTSEENSSEGTAGIPRKHAAFTSAAKFTTLATGTFFLHFTTSSCDHMFQKCSKITETLKCTLYVYVFVG